MGGSLQTNCPAGKGSWRGPRISLLSINATDLHVQPGRWTRRPINGGTQA